MKKVVGYTGPQPASLFLKTTKRLHGFVPGDGGSRGRNF
jgi:hypothetical protein